MNVGIDLAQARQELGLSLEDVSGRTKIAVERLAAIEQMDVEHLPTDIYLKGFLRAYAAEVGLDPQDVTQRYLAELETVQHSLYGDVAAVADDAPPAREDAATVVVPPSPGEERVYATSAASATKPRYRSLLIVPLVALVAGVLLAANLDNLPWSSKSTPVAVEDAPTVDAPAADAPEPQPAAPEPQPAAPAPDTAAKAARQEPEATDVTGSWRLTNRIESTNYGAFKGLALEFDLDLQQDGNRVTGKGTKVSENGNALPAAGRTPISIDGTLEGDRLELTFTETGAQRSSTGKISLELTDGDTLRGTFVSDAARARGTSVAQRAP